MSPDLAARVASSCRRGAAGVLGVALVWTTYQLGGFRPETLTVTTALLALAACLEFLARFMVGGGHPMEACLVPFLVYAAINATWISPVAWRGWQDWYLWLHAVAGFWLGLSLWRERGARRVMVGAVGLCAVVAAGCAFYQRAVQLDWLPMGRVQVEQYAGRLSGSFGIPNSLAALMLLVLPGAVAMAWRGRGRGWRRLGVGLTVVFLAALFLTVSRGAWLSAGLTVASVPLWWGRGAWWRRLGVSLALVVAGGVLLTAVVGVSPVAHARLSALVRDLGERSRPIMWKGAWQLHRDAPVWGTGAGSYAVLFERHRPEFFQDDPNWPHNDYLGTLSDYGWLGVGLSFGVAVAVAVWAYRNRGRGTGDRDESVRWLRRGGALGVMAFALSLGVDFHLKIPALGMLVGVVAACVVASYAPGRSVPMPSMGLRVLSLVLAMGVGAWAAAVVVPLYLAEGARYAARQRIDRWGAEAAGQPLPRYDVEWVLSDFERAARLHPGNAQAWADLAYAYELLAQIDPGRRLDLGKHAEEAANQALARSRVVPEFWIRRGVALDLQGRWGEASADFTEAARLAPAAAWVWFYQAFHLSQRRGAHSMAIAAAVVCLRLDPYHPRAKALLEALTANSAK